MLWYTMYEYSVYNVVCVLYYGCNVGGKLSAGTIRSECVCVKDGMGEWNGSLCIIFGVLTENVNLLSA